MVELKLNTKALGGGLKCPPPFNMTTYTNVEPTDVGTGYTDESAIETSYTDEGAISTDYVDESDVFTEFNQVEPTGAGFAVPEGDEYDRGAGSPITEYTQDETT